MKLDTVLVENSSCGDTRTCNVDNVSPFEFSEAIANHREDVLKVMSNMGRLVANAGKIHDITKLTQQSLFFKDFRTKFESTEWFDMHVRAERHHLDIPGGVPIDVNIVDLIECLVDRVASYVARSKENDTYKQLRLDPQLLADIIVNTETMLLKSIKRR